MTRKKSQASVEFLLAVGFILVIFFFLLWLISERRAELRATEQRIAERGLCLKISNLINSIFLNGDGSRIDIETDYQAQISNRTIIVGPDKVRCGFITQDVYNATYEFFVLDQGNIRIRNENGMIVINNV